MADYIPFITSEDSGNLVKKVYPDADIVRVPLDRAERVRHLLPASSKVWLDPCVDGMDEFEARRSQSDKKNSWFEFMSDCANFEKIGTPTYHAKPDLSEVYTFVKAVMDKCAKYRPTWITVPQFPLVSGSERNKINRVMAAATGKWKGSSGFPGSLILPLLFTHQEQVNRKTARNRKLEQAERGYHEAQADGVWVVDMSLMDDSGSSTLRNKRFLGIVDLHEELNSRISSKIRIAGPYWGLNLVLWTMGQVDHLAIGIGAGYQYFPAGRPGRQPSTKLALPSLRRRVGIGSQFKKWLDSALAKLAPSHPAHGEFSEIRKQYTALSESDRAREQVARFYKQWFSVIAAVPKAGRSMALFQDLSAAYSLGKSLPDLDDERTARRPEAVAEPLMLSCL
jgi:hypothetical protein